MTAAGPGGTLQDLPQITAPDPEVAGRIVVLDCVQDLLFPVQRVYWIHGMKAGEVRGAHGHRDLMQAVVALTGAVRFELDDGTTRTAHHLSRPDQYLIVPPGMWRDFTALETGTTLLVLASAAYDEADYIRDYAEFRAFKSLAG